MTTLRRRAGAAIATPTTHSANALRGIGASFAQIYFVPSASIGVLLLAVMALADATAAAMGLAAATVATGLAWLLRLPAQTRRAGLYGYNAALTGIAFGTLWQHDTPAWQWLMVCVALTVVATALLARCRVPALTGPFVAVMALTVHLQPTLGLVARLPAPDCDASSPGFVFCTIGQVVFVGPLVLGMLTWYLLALWNARATVWALAATLAVWGVAALAFAIGPTGLIAALQAQAVGIGVNAFLTALALGVFGISAGWRFAGALAAACLCVALGQLGWPYFTLPFNGVTWILLAARALRLIR